MNDFELLDRVTIFGYAEYKKTMEKELLYRLLRAVQFDQSELARRLKMDRGNLGRLLRGLEIRENLNYF